MSCERIVSSSLHGLVIADAYGIPNAWLNSDGGAGGSRPGGGEFKFYDYFASVNKLRHAQDFHASVGKELTPDYLLDQFWFDDQLIDFDHEALLDACPFVERAQS
jgi:pyruvyltransferase